MVDELGYGPVAVREPGRDVRIGYYDNDESDPDTGDDVAVIYYSSPPFLNGYHFVDPSCLAPIDTDALWERRSVLRRVMSEADMARAFGKRSGHTYKRLYTLTLELIFVESLLSDRMISAQQNEGRGGVKVFISYSSVDRKIATWLSVDLANEGHLPWLDEWEIKAGDSIPNKIGRGLDECDYLLVLLSPDSVESGWVEREWSAKYWAEAEDGHIKVIPVLLRECTVPALLRMKKYVDLRRDYHRGLEQIIEALAAPVSG
ncbi:toll/interleukin-1 receptor domain-containing protein [Lentzea sp. NPDC054927]